MTFQMTQDFMAHFHNVQDDGTNTTVLPNPEFLSIYIPFLPNNLVLDCVSYEGVYEILQDLETETDFKNLFEEILGVGKVKRVDFVVRDGKKCAFVHFHHWYDNANAKQMQAMIKTSISAKIKTFSSGRERYRIRTEKKVVRNSIEQTIQEYPFLTFKQNFKAIPEFLTTDDAIATTLPNIHQVMHWNAELEKTVAEQKARILELEQLLEQRVAVVPESAVKQTYAANNCKDCEKELCACGLSSV